MQKIKIMTDSACDLSPEQEKELDIKILCFPVTVGDTGYRERIDFTNDEFYDIMDGFDGIPTTAQITPFEFVEAYNELYEEGYSDVIYVSISSTGSATFNNATMSKATFFEEHPDAKDKFNIHIVDSMNYTGVEGFPIVQAAQKLKKGACVKELIDYLEDWYAGGMVIFTCYTLEYAKRSGRVSCAAAFVGELLGLRPILKIADGVSSTIDKVRGEKGLLPKIVEKTFEEMIPQTPYALVIGSMEQEAKDLAALMTKKVGYPPIEVFKVGSAVACNVGHKVVGTIFKGNNRRELLYVRQIAGRIFK